MEIKKIILDVNETAVEMKNILSQNIEGFVCSEPKIIEIYGVELKSLVPAVCIEASKRDEKKYLLYSPLTRQMLCLDEGGFSAPAIGTSYQNGPLSAKVVEDEGTRTLELEYNDVQAPCPCYTVEKAKQRLGALLALTGSPALRAEYYDLPPEQREFKPAMIIGSVYWCLKLETKQKRAETIVVSVTEGNVFSLGIQADQINEITEKCYCHAITTDVYWNGKYFSVAKE